MYTCTFDSVWLCFMSFWRIKARSRNSDTFLTLVEPSNSILLTETLMPELNKITTQSLFYLFVLFILFNKRKGYLQNCDGGQPPALNSPHVFLILSIWTAIVSWLIILRFRSESISGRSPAPRALQESEELKELQGKLPQWRWQSLKGCSGQKCAACAKFEMGCDKEQEQRVGNVCMLWTRMLRPKVRRKHCGKVHERNRLACGNA